MDELKVKKSKKLKKNSEHKGNRRKIGSKRYVAMKAKLVEILKEEGVVTTESVARICNLKDNVARDWIHTFEIDGLITFWIRMRTVKIYKSSTIKRNCGISVSYNQEGFT